MPHDNAMDRLVPFLSEISGSVKIETPNGIARAGNSGRWRKGREGFRGGQDDPALNTNAGDIDGGEWGGNRSGE